MKKINRIFQRGEIFYYRRRVPKALRASKSHTVIISLKTSDINTALSLCGWYDRKFDNLVLKSRMTATKIDKKAILNFEIETRSDGTIKASGNAEELEIMLKHGLLNIGQLVNENIKSFEKSKEKRMTLSEGLKLYDEEKIRKQTKNEGDTKTPSHYRRLVEIVGDINIIDFTATEANFVIDTLTALPKNPRPYRDLTAWEVIEAMDEDEEKVSVKTINDHISSYRCFFDFIERDFPDEIKSNFFSKKDIKNEADRIQKALTRLSYTTEELIKIFNHKTFTLGLFEKKYQFWAPIIGLFTGARANEVAQLRTYDIKEMEGVHYFDISLETNEGDENKKKLKNPGSIRKTPIHRQLIKLGFLDFVNERKNKNELFLFDDLGNFSERDGFARYVSTNYSEIVNSIGIRKTFRSFRGYMATELRDAGVDEMERYLICGRETRFKTTEEKHYLRISDLKHLQNEINKVDFSDIIKNVKYINYNSSGSD